MSTTTEEESASAGEASQEMPPAPVPEYKELARDMFEKITEYLNGELSGNTVKIFNLYFILLPPPSY